HPADNCTQYVCQTHAFTLRKRAGVDQSLHLGNDLKSLLLRRGGWIDGNRQRLGRGSVAAVGDLDHEGSVGYGGSGSAADCAAGTERQTLRKRSGRDRPRVTAS